MGQHQTNPFREGSQLMAEYRVERREKEQMLTYLTHVQTNKQYLLKEFTFNEWRQFSITIEKLNSRKALVSNHLTLLKMIQERLENQMCSNFYKVYTLWEYSHKSLEDDISQKLKNKRPFSKQQLWNILASAVEGLKALQQKQIKHECLTTESILHDKQGIYKVADPLAIGLGSNLDNTFDSQRVQNIYLSPEQCWSLQHQKPLPNKNAFKNDVFTLGMIFLQCGLLQNQAKCYEDGCKKIRWDDVKENMQKCCKIYGNDWRKVIELMLSPDISVRPDWLQLNKLITSVNRQSSAQRNPFLIKQLKPQKFQYGRMSAGLPTILSVQSEKTLTQLSHQYLSYDERKMLRPHQNALPFANSNSIPTKINYLSPVKPPMPISIRPQEINKKQILSPQKDLIRQITFNSVPPSHTSTHPSIHHISTKPSNIRLDHHYHQTHSLSINFDSTFGKILTNDPRSIVQHLPNQALTSPDNQRIRFSNKINPIEKSPLPNDGKPTQHHQQKQEISLKSQQLQFVQQYFKGGSHYEGYKLKGMRHGRGKFFYQDGGSYDGQWKDNKMNGSGTLYYQSNTKAFQGQWTNDQFDGVGILYNQYPEIIHHTFDYRNFDQIGYYWVSYQGHFKRDSKEGQGTLRFSNEDEFKGNFKEDMVEGQGYFFTKNKAVIHGIWHENHLVQLLN